MTIEEAKVQLDKAVVDVAEAAQALSRGADSPEVILSRAKMGRGHGHALVRSADLAVLREKLGAWTRASDEFLGALLASSRALDSQIAAAQESEK